ncbi:MAG: UDP-N-acetylmuramoyl-tripeptide--D-alanyl-D-alanine ligase [Spirochaetales bacterium]|nr:UDP-N-acetylmuramoyl-tripeptide--D-alanyl-D-alanine ligase [Spirochaetales bacterium]
MTSINHAGTLFTVGEVAQATGGVVVRRSAKPIRSVVIDSRTAVDFCLFVPLAGERANGHDFIPEAAGRGASAVLAGAGVWANQGERLAEIAERDDISCVVADDTLAALQDLARFHMARFPRLFRVGVTGSSGKTTVKELIGAVLSRNAPTMVSAGNLNSEIGVPLSAFAVTAEHRYGVFEMGVNRPGEMDVLASIVRPNLAVLTNIGTAHIGPLGSREGIAAEKKKIASYLKKSEAFFIYEEESFYGFLSRDSGGRVIPYGPRHTQGLQGGSDQGLDGTAIDWEGLLIRFPLAGFHNYRNALAAIAVASFLKLPPQSVKEGLEAAAPLFGRSQILRGKITVIQDCYNANPDSMAQALAFLSEVSWTGRRIAVLGSMRELGDHGPGLHRTLGRNAAALTLDAVFFFGEETRDALDAYREARGAAAAEWCGDFDELARRVTAVVRTGDLVLVKGSRALELERLVPFLSAQDTAGEGV